MCGIYRVAVLMSESLEATLARKLRKRLSDIANARIVPCQVLAGVIKELQTVKFFATWNSTALGCISTKMQMKSKSNRGRYGRNPMVHKNELSSVNKFQAVGSFPRDGIHVSDIPSEFKHPQSSLLNPTKMPRLRFTNALKPLKCLTLPVVTTHYSVSYTTGILRAGQKYCRVGRM